MIFEKVFFFQKFPIYLKINFQIWKILIFFRNFKISENFWTFSRILEKARFFFRKYRKILKISDFGKSYIFLLARIAYVDGFVHEMSRGAAHAFLYGLNVLFSVFSGSCSSAFNEITFFYKIKIQSSNTIGRQSRFSKKCFYQNRFKIARFNRDILIFRDFYLYFLLAPALLK